MKITVIHILERGISITNKGIVTVLLTVAVAKMKIAETDIKISKIARDLVTNLADEKQNVTIEITDIKIIHMSKFNSSTLKKATITNLATIMLARITNVLTSLNVINTKVDVQITAILTTTASRSNRKIVATKIMTLGTVVSNRKSKIGVIRQIAAGRSKSKIVVPKTGVILVIDVTSSGNRIIVIKTIGLLTLNAVTTVRACD